MRKKSKKELLSKIFFGVVVVGFFEVSVPTVAVADCSAYKSPVTCFDAQGCTWDEDQGFCGPDF